MLLGEIRSGFGWKRNGTVLANKGFQMQTNGTHLSRFMFVIENLYCSTWREFLTVFTRMESAPNNEPFSSKLRCLGSSTRGVLLA